MIEAGGWRGVKVAIRSGLRQDWIGHRTRQSRRKELDPHLLPCRVCSYSYKLHLHLPGHSIFLHHTHYTFLPRSRFSVPVLMLPFLLMLMLLLPLVLVLVLMLMLQSPHLPMSCIFFLQGTGFPRPLGEYEYGTSTLG